MFNAHPRDAITALAFLLVGCVAQQTPAQVAATDPTRIITYTASTAAMVKCLPARMEDMHAGWTVSVRGESDRPRIHAHGGLEVGTVALIALDDGRAALHFSTNIFTMKRFADELEDAIRACDKP